MSSRNQSSPDRPSTFTETFDWDERESVQVAVIDALAAVTDQEPTEMEPLAHFVDPESLDSLFAPTGKTPRSRGRVEFQYQDCSVAVSADGTVTVTPHAE